MSLPVVDTHAKIADYILKIITTDGLKIPAAHAGVYLECVDWLQAIQAGELTLVSSENEAPTPQGV